MTSLGIKVARWVSIGLHPFVMIAILVADSVARRSGFSSILASVGIVAAFTTVPVATLMVIKVRRGTWKNVDASEPRERPALYTVGIGGVVALTCFLVLTGRDAYLLRGAVVTLGLLLVCAAITPVIKVSLHIATAALTATALVLGGSLVGWTLAALLPVLCWARLALKRHRPAEIIAGAALGVVSGAILSSP